MCDLKRVIPRSRGKPKRFLWPNRAGPPCRARAPARDAPPGQTVGADVLIGPGKGRALALREHIPRLNSPPNLAETIPKPIVWLSRAGPPTAVMRRKVPPEPEEHIPRLNGPPNRLTAAQRFLWLGRAGPPGKERAPSSA